MLYSHPYLILPRLGAVGPIGALAPRESMPVLMHISDLHRSTEEPVSNAELVAALERDLHRQSDEHPSISRPDALIVSGDLVKGLFSSKLGLG